MTSPHQLNDDSAMEGLSAESLQRGHDITRVAWLKKQSDEMVADAYNRTIKAFAEMPSPYGGEFGKMPKVEGEL